MSAFPVLPTFEFTHLYSQKELMYLHYISYCVIFHRMLEKSRRCGLCLGSLTALIIVLLSSNMSSWLLQTHVYKQGIPVITKQHLQSLDHCPGNVSEDLSCVCVQYMIRIFS